MKQRIQSLLRIKNGGVREPGWQFAFESAIPSNGTSGYSKGCLLVNKTTGELYINKGTYESCTFKNVTTEA